MRRRQNVRSSLVLCAFLAGCSASPNDTNGNPAGASGQPSSGSGNLAGRSNGGGATSAAGAFSSAGTGNASAGTGSGGSSGGESLAGSSAGGVAGSPPSNGAGAGGIVSGAGGSAGGAIGGAGGTINAAGSGGKVDQDSLPNITIHLAGDSTMSSYPASTTQEGWGQELGQYFISKVAIDNLAQPGANVQDFYGGRWKTLIGKVKQGDYVMAAFGTNDSGTAHGPVSPANFKAQFSQMADEVAMKNATFILTTPSPLQIWSGSKIDNSRLQPYCDALTSLGATKGLLVDDLNARGVDYYNMIGPTSALALTFSGDKAHFNRAGATAMAKLATAELVRIRSPLAAYLK